MCVCVCVHMHVHFCVHDPHLHVYDLFVCVCMYVCMFVQASIDTRTSHPCVHIHVHETYIVVEFVCHIHTYIRTYVWV